jgi:hypothetical protein
VSKPCVPAYWLVIRYFDTDVLGTGNKTTVDLYNSVILKDNIVEIIAARNDIIISGTRLSHANTSKSIEVNLNVEASILAIFNLFTVIYF